MGKRMQYDQVTKELVEKSAAKLRPREVIVLQLRVVDGLSLRGVGLRMRISKERVRAIEARAFKKIRDEAG
jgi:RNA polymerase sigma factor (sigma-70 family)